MPISQAEAFEIGDQRRSLVVYRLVRGAIRLVLYPYLRVRSRGSIPADGPVIVAPVHRSNLDSMLLGGITRRRIRALGKKSLFDVPVVGWVIAALGAVPVDRGTADREAIRLSEQLLERGELYLVFPEGTRQDGREIGEIYDGVAFLAARTGAPVVPVGIAGTDRAMPSGAKFPRPTKVRIVVGDPLPAPTADGRVPRSALRTFTDDLRAALQAAHDDAHAMLD